jgi:hypothetical protein
MIDRDLLRYTDIIRLYVCIFRRSFLVVTCNLSEILSRELQDPKKLVVQI